jgi:hypothetical protein
MAETTRTRAVPDSPECTGAKQMNWPEMHRRCAGNSVLRIPGVYAPVLTYSCGCTCHTGGSR